MFPAKFSTHYSNTTVRKLLNIFYSYPFVNKVNWAVIGCIVPWWLPVDTPRYRIEVFNGFGFDDFLDLIGKNIFWKMRCLYLWRLFLLAQLFNEQRRIIPFQEDVVLILAIQFGLIDIVSHPRIFNLLYLIHIIFTNIISAFTLFIS